MVNVKKIFTTALISTVVSGLGWMMTSDETSAASGKLYKKDIDVLIDGKELKTNSPIYIQSGRILIPMRDFYENMDASVYWNQKAKEVKAIKNGNEILLKIGQKYAHINSNKVGLDVPAIIKDYHTYVPLRFVGESFDSKVSWNSKKQEVSVETGSAKGEDQDQVDPVKNQGNFTLHINNKRVKMETDPLIKGGRMYMSSTYFLENLEHTDSLWKDEETFEILIDGLSFIFKEGEGTIIVDNEEIETDLKPFIQNGEMFLPVHFIVNSLGGNLKYKRATEELYVYLNRYMFHSEFLEKREKLMGRPQNVPSAQLAGDRRLLVSDNPERLTPSVLPSNRETLAEDTIDEMISSKKHRIFGWNVNDMGQPVKIGITVENLSTDHSIKIEDARGYSRKSNNGWINYDVGLPMADAMLNDKLNQSFDQPVTVAPGETILISEYRLDQKYILGFIEDLTINSTDPSKKAQYKIRTVMGQEDDDLTGIRSNAVPVDFNAQHPRGVWASSELTATLPSYSAGSDEVSYSLSNGRTDHLLTSDTALDDPKNGIPNPGHFGMKYSVKVPIINPTGESKKIRIRAAARGGAYSGAVKINGEVHLIPTLQAAIDTVTLLEKDIMNYQEEIDIELIHAGGSALPVAIYVDTIE